MCVCVCVRARACVRACVCMRGMCGMWRVSVWHVGHVCALCVHACMHACMRACISPPYIIYAISLTPKNLKISGSNQKPFLKLKYCNYVNILAHQLLDST